MGCGRKGDENARCDRKRQGRVEKVFSQLVDEPGIVLRLFTNKSELGLVKDVEKEGDQVVEHEGSTVLVIDEDSSAALEGVSIDYQDTAEGPHLVLTKETKGKPVG